MAIRSQVYICEDPGTRLALSAFGISCWDAAYCCLPGSVSKPTSFVYDDTPLTFVFRPLGICETGPLFGVSFYSEKPWGFDIFFATVFTLELLLRLLAHMAMSTKAPCNLWNTKVSIVQRERSGQGWVGGGFLDICVSMDRNDASQNVEKLGYLISDISYLMGMIRLAHGLNICSWICFFTGKTLLFPKAECQKKWTYQLLITVYNYSQVAMWWKSILIHSHSGFSSYTWYPKQPGFKWMFGDFQPLFM